MTKQYLFKQLSLGELKDKAKEYYEENPVGKFTDTEGEVETICLRHFDAFVEWLYEKGLKDLFKMFEK